MALADSTETNRYLAARRNPDFTIDQDWSSYTPAEHERWDRLFHRSQVEPERSRLRRVPRRHGRAAALRSAASPTWRG